MSVEIWSGGKEDTRNMVSPPCVFPDGNTILVCVSMFYSASYEAWYSTNGGTSWTNISGASFDWPGSTPDFRAPSTKDYEFLYLLPDHTTSWDFYTIGASYSPSTTGLQYERYTWNDGTNLPVYQDQYNYSTGVSFNTEQPKVTMFSFGGDLYFPTVYQGTGGQWYLDIIRRTSGGTWSTYQSLGAVDASGSYGTASVTFHHTGDGYTVKDSEPNIYVYLSTLGAGSLIRRYAYSSGPTWTGGTALTGPTNAGGGNVVYNPVDDKVMVPSFQTSTTNPGFTRWDESVTGGSTSLYTTDSRAHIQARNCRLFVDGAGNVYHIYQVTSTNLGYVKHDGSFGSTTSLYTTEILAGYGNGNVIGLRDGYFATPDTLNLTFSSNWQIYSDTIAIEAPASVVNDGFGAVTI